MEKPTKSKKTEAKGKISAKLSGHEQVVDYLNRLEHPLKKEIEEIRRVILSVNNQISEHIKWNAPSFCYQNDDRMTFNMRGKDSFLLVFHSGAKVKPNSGETTLFEDTTGLLEWVTHDRATVKFTSINDVEAKKDKLAEVVTKWIEATES